MKNWNRTGKIKAIVLGVLVLSNLISNIDKHNLHSITIIILPFVFSFLATPLIIIINKVMFDGETCKPNWNDNPLILKKPMAFFQFGAYFFVIAGLSILIGAGIKSQNLSYLGLLNFSMGIGIFGGLYFALNWKKLETAYFITGGIGVLIFVVYLFIFLITRSNTKDEDIIRHFTERFEFYTNNTNEIINQINSIEFLDNIEYEINFYDSDIEYTIFKYYTYHEKSVKIPQENKSIIDSIFSLMDCRHIDFVKDQTIKLYTDVSNWNSNNIQLIKVLNDSIFKTKYSNWDFIKEGELPDTKNNWIYHIKDSWHIMSIKKYQSTKNIYPSQDDLIECKETNEDDKLLVIGQEYIDKSGNEYTYLKHGKWVYLDSNNYIVKEKIYCFDTLKELIEHPESNRNKIKTDTTIGYSKELGKLLSRKAKWEKKKEVNYIVE
jgi:hypothetical protein